jgi:hypothetical protein
MLPIPILCYQYYSYSKNTEMVHIKNRDNLVRGVCGDCLKNKVEYLKHRELAKKHLESLRANRKGS